MSGPLTGLVVVDSGWGMASAVTSMIFADYGATVVKVERPGGGADRDWVGRSVFDRSKRSVELDLSSATGIARLHELMAVADVFVESNRPGVAAKLGFGWEAVRDRFPALVYTSISAYGQDTPDRDRPGFDCLVAARMGLMAENATDDGMPVFLGHPHLAYGTAFVTVISTLAALRAREVTGRGQYVDSSLLDAVQAQSPMNWMFNEKNVSYLAKSRKDGFGRNRIITDLFQCADGEWLMVHTGGDGGFKRMMDLLGIGEHVRQIDGLEMSVPLDDEELRLARHVAPTMFGVKPRQAWIDLFHAADLAALPVLRPAEVLDDEQVRFAQVPVDLLALDGRTFRQAGPVIRFDRSPAPTPSPAPSIGRDNAILDAIGSLRSGLPAVPVETGQPLRHALEGLRVLDLSSFFATAYGAKFLSDLGADVIKVETLSGDQMRPLPDPFEACQRGKRALAVDLKSAQGRAIVHDLVATADVVMHNLRPGKAEKLGIGYDALSAIRPDLVYCYLPGFGSQGPKSGLKSFAPLVSGFTGLLYEGAGAGNAPVRRVMGNEDYNNGFLGAIAALMGLLHRARTGEGQYIEMPQLHSSLFVTTGQVIDTATGQVVHTHQLDSERRGFGPLYHLYRTADGWLTVACVGASAHRRLADLLDRPDLAADVEALHQLLTTWLASRPTSDAFDALDQGGIACEITAEVPGMDDFLWHEWALDAQRVFEYQHPTLGYVRDIGLSVHLSDTPGCNKGPQVELGRHTVEILRELGYADDRISALLAGRVCIDAGGEGGEGGGEGG